MSYFTEDGAKIIPKSFREKSNTICLLMKINENYVGETALERIEVQFTMTRIYLWVLRDMGSQEF